jgi:phage terminase Nu1 subunit (DNA packaging protein)
MPKAKPNPTVRPQTDEIRAAEAAARLGLTAQAIGQWAAKSGAPVRKDGTALWLKWPAFARWREEQQVKNALAELAPTVSLDEARTRKALAEAELAELDVAKARGEFVSVADFEAALARVLDRLMARLRAMPLRLSHLGVDAETAAEAEIERVITELHGFDEDVLDEPADEAKEAA